jgi:hypothetical protein
LNAVDVELKGEVAARNGVELRRWRVGDCSRVRASTEARTLENEERRIMKRGLFVTIASLLLFTITGFTQEVRNEVSVQGTGFFTKDSSGDGISRTTTNAGGLQVGYRYHINRWLSAEANYGFDRNTQKYFSNAGQSRVKSDVHGVTADVVVKLPLHISKFSPYAIRTSASRA